ncbi:MAG: hypothetical protein ACTHMD_03815 [Flavisolibacter sp.]
MKRETTPLVASVSASEKAKPKEHQQAEIKKIQHRPLVYQERDTYCRLLFLFTTIRMIRSSEKITAVCELMLIYFSYK